MSRVTVTNPYDLLTDENEDRTNVPAPKKEQKPAAPAAKPAAPVAKSAPKAAAKPAAKTDSKAAPKAADNKAAPKANNNVVRQQPPRDSNQNLQERDKESRAPRDKRDYRQPRPAGDKSRAFDRKSGTGRPANENKKGGQGKGNWGGEVDAKEGVEALKEKEEKVVEEKEGEEKKEGETAEGEKKEGETKEETPKDKEDNTLTLDEYLAKKKEKKVPVVAAFQPRTVNADEFASAGLVALQRGEEVIAPLNPKKEKKVAEKPATPKEEKPAGEKKKNLAAELLTFSSHQEEKSKERRSFNRREGGYERRDGGFERRDGGERRAPRPNRGPRNDAKGAAAAPPAANLEKDFPSFKQ